MSIVDRLFPASELEILRASPYDFDLEAPMVKRRKLSSSQSSVSSTTRRPSSDSGYSSDEAISNIDSWQPPRKRSRNSLDSTSSSPANTPAQFHQSTLARNYFTSMRAQDRSKHRLRTQSDHTSLRTQDLKQFYNQITLARTSSRHSISGLPTPPYSNGGSSSSPSTIHEEADEALSCVKEIGQGWTAGPKSATQQHISARLLDGMRITTHERSMLNSLFPASYTMQQTPIKPEPEATPIFTYPQYQAQTVAPSPLQSSFAGIAIGAYDDEEEETDKPDLDGLDLGEVVNIEGEGTGKVEDFFNIEEASDDSVSLDGGKVESPE